MCIRWPGGRSEPPDMQTPPAAGGDRGRCGILRAVANPAAYSFGWVIIGKLSLRNGVTGRPSTLYRLHTGLSDQA